MSLATTPTQTPFCSSFEAGEKLSYNGPSYHELQIKNLL
jgi:hypothetical protein